MPRAAIDLGSNSCLLLVLDDDGAVLDERAAVVGLGRGLGDAGVLRPDRIDAACHTLRTWAAVAATHGVPAEAIAAVTTSAVRRARDADAFLDRVRHDTGVSLRVLSGAQEAHLTRLGALSDPSILPAPDADVVVVDLGGGSTEVARGRPEVAGPSQSVEIGSVRLTERFLGVDTRHDPGGLARLVEHVDRALAEAPLSPRPEAVVGVAGTVTTLVAHTLAHRTWRPDEVHGARLTRTQLAAVVELLMPATPEARRQAVPASPERADFLVAGATILDRVLARAGLDHLVASVRDLRWGALLAAS